MTTAVARSDPGDLNLEWPHGDAVDFTFTFEDEFAAPIDLSSYTFYADVRNRKRATTSFSFSVDTTDAATGVLVLTTPTDADLPLEGLWDLRQKAAGGEVTTLLAGEVTILKTISDTS